MVLVVVFRNWSKNFYFVVQLDYVFRILELSSACLIDAFNNYMITEIAVETLVMLFEGHLLLT